jgi:peptidoglycan/LPS O-acetylase OafA/YrhL
VVVQLGILNYFSPSLYLRPWFRFDSIMIGCCIALGLYHLQPQRDMIARLSRWAAPVIAFPVLVFWTQFGERLSVLRPVFLTVQMLLAAGLLLHLVVFPQTIAARILAIRPLRFLGRISYSVYLWQQMFLMTNQPSWGFVRRFPWNLIAALVAGIASHYLVEHPFLKLKDRVSSLSSKAKTIPVGMATGKAADAS